MTVLAAPADERPREAPQAAASAAPPRRRSVAIDNAKAIGIVLVVIGHAPAIAPWLTDAIFAFHMPFFFLLSGSLVSAERLASPLATRARTLARTLLVPYLFFFVLAWVYWLIAKRHGLRMQEFAAVSAWQPWGGLLAGTGDALYVDPALWFFPGLFVTALVHHAVQRAVGLRVAMLVLLVIAIVVTTARPGDWPALPWSADCALVAGVFYAWGAWWHAEPRRSRAGISFATRAGIAALGLMLALALVPLTGRVDLSHLAFGRVRALYLPIAALGTVGALAFASLVAPSRAARWLSDNTLVIFPLHMLFFSVVTGVGILVLDDGAAFKNGSGWVAVVYVGVALALCLPASIVLRRLAPWLFGVARRAAASTADGR